jgi:hypothetical protein
MNGVEEEASVKLDNPFDEASVMGGSIYNEASAKVRSVVRRGSTKLLVSSMKVVHGGLLIVSPALGISPKARSRLYTKQSLSHLLLLSFALVLGGCIICAIESYPEATTREQAQAALLAETASLRADLLAIVRAHGREYNTTALLLARIESHVVVRNQFDLPSTAEDWSLIRSIFFCFTLITTIGYGTFAPVTSSGQVFVCVYSIFGIAVFVRPCRTVASPPRPPTRSHAPVTRCPSRGFAVALRQVLWPDRRGGCARDAPHKEALEVRGPH